MIRAALLLVFACCGAEVDLGGSAGGGNVCDLCSPTQPCKTGVVCALIGGNGFCVSSCQGGAACGSSESCSSVTLAASGSAMACVPSGGMCAPPPPPTIDGAALDRCGARVGPSVSAMCHACSKSSPSCQANGCYGGYWCNTSFNDCGPPPKGCP